MIFLRFFATQWKIGNKSFELNFSAIMNVKIFLFIVLFAVALLKAKIIINKVEVHCKAEIWNSSVAFVNTKLGASVNLTIDINQEPDNIAFLIAISISNPLNRQSFAEVMKYNVDICNLQASMKNNYFVRKVFTEMQKLSRLKFRCPMDKGQYRIPNWIIRDDIFPKAMPRNIKGIGTFKFFTNISNTKVEIWNVRVYGEFK